MDTLTEPEFLQAFLLEHIVDRFPRSKGDKAVNNVTLWITEYLELHPGCLEVASSKLNAGFQMDELLEFLPDFLPFMKGKEPGLLESPAGMY